MGKTAAKYSPQQVREWGRYLRRVADGLNDSIENEHVRMAGHFYNVHYAIGPEHLTESDIFALDKEYLELVAEQERKTPEKAMQELIESLETAIREGSNPKLRFMNQSVWNSGLKNYLVELLAKLTRKN